MTLAVLQQIPQRLPAALSSLSIPRCADPHCPNLHTTWQRWWARKQGIHFEDKWFCSARCFERGLAILLGRLQPDVCRREAAPSRIPLGLLLLGQGIISEAQLRFALDEQRRSGQRRIGEWLVELGMASSQDVLRALALQQNCPLLGDSAKRSVPMDIHFPLHLSRRYRAVPVHFSRSDGRLYMGFAGPVSHRLAASAAHLMRAQVYPCVISQNLYSRASAQWERASQGEAVCVEVRQTLAETAHMIASYAEQTEAERCAAAQCEEYIWIRLYGSAGYLDLLFRC